MGRVSKEVTQHNKDRFLEYYPKFESVEKTSKAVGISKGIVYKWLGDDEAYADKTFSNKVALIKKELELRLIDKHEQNIDDVAFDPNTKPQSRIFGSLVRLRAIAPDKYRERPPETRLIGDIQVKLAVPPYEDNPVMIEPTKLLTGNTEGNTLHNNNSAAQDEKE